MSAVARNIINMLGKKYLRSIENTEMLQTLSKPNGHKSTFTVSIEGNIGSGKSTLIDYFKDSPNVEAVPEPVSEWCNLHGHNALQLLYEDPKRWCFTFNTYAQLTRLRMHNKETNKSVKMLERSLYSTRYCFVENSKMLGEIGDAEYEVLTRWFDWLTSTQKAGVDLFVYLRTSPEISYDRVKKRSRKEEAGVPFEFISRLHDLHEDWLIHRVKFTVPAPVLVLDASHDLPAMKSLFETRREEILCGYN